MARGFKLVDLVGAKVYSEGGREPIGRIVALGVDGEFVRATVVLDDVAANTTRSAAPHAPKATPSPQLSMKGKLPAPKRRGFFD